AAVVSSPTTNPCPAVFDVTGRPSGLFKTTEPAFTLIPPPQLGVVAPAVVLFSAPLNVIVPAPSLIKSLPAGTALTSKLTPLSTPIAEPVIVTRPAFGNIDVASFVVTPPMFSVPPPPGLLANFTVELPVTRSAPSCAVPPKPNRF